MGGRAEPPEGAPEGGSGGEDEFRSVVFDESFVRAARIQELSATERMSSGTRPIRRRGLRGAGLSRQALALMVLVSVAFAAAVYLGSRHPYPQPGGSAAELSISVLPLSAGAGGIPTLSPGTSTAAPSGSATADPSASRAFSPPPTAGPSAGASPSAEAQPDEYPVGSSGLILPMPRDIGDFTQGQVLQALTLVQSYLKTSSLDPRVLTGGDTDSVGDLLAAGQQAQFRRSVRNPTDDRRHELTGWMVRFDTSRVKLAPGQPIRASGTLQFSGGDGGVLRLSSDYTFVYALSQVVPKPGPGPVAPQSVVLFTVRRAISYLVTMADLGDNRIELADSVVQAGAMSCGSDPSRFLVPVFPGQDAQGSLFAPSASTVAASAPTPSWGTGVDPFDKSRQAWSVCGVMSGPTP